MNKITRKQLIKKYIDFFKSKNHKEIPNSSLVPENDPTVLFTTAGMHPLVPFLLGQKHPLGKRLCNVQRCIRTGDIDCVGDETHHTFFEMLGNWSLGDYFKEDAIKFSFEFLTKELKIPLERFAVTVFGGDKREKQVPKDDEAAEIWHKLGISKDRIAYLEGGIYESKNNWWGPAGQTGPCGPDTEMFYWKPNNKPTLKKFNPNDNNWVEIWNDVLMQYNKDEKGNYNEASQKNIDAGMGVERTIAVLNGLEDNYLGDSFYPIIQEIEKLSGKPYKGNEKEMRIIADHIKAAVFLFNDGVQPGHKERGYVLKRLIRRAIIYGKKLGIKKNEFTADVAEVVIKIYSDYFPKNDKRVWFVGRDTKTFILDEIDREEGKFNYKLEEGFKILRNMIAHQKKISPQETFLLYQSYGFPIELTKEIAFQEWGVDVDEKGFNEELSKHQELSRTASAGKFKSGLADNSEQTTKLHTATHLLNQALREVLHKKDIYQKGSNITPERIRFDFNFDRKLTEDEIKKVEDWVNDKIDKKLPVVCEALSVGEAKKSGAQGVFDSKYGDKVKVYSVGKKGKEVSKEICAGPHVSNLGELGKFRIIKEESSSSGVRRIKAVLE